MNHFLRRTGRTPPLLGLGLLLLTWTGTAEAVQLGNPTGSSLLNGATLNFNNTTIYKYNITLDDDEDDERPAPFPFHELVNRTTATVRMQYLSLGVQLDTLASWPGCSDTSFQEAWSERHGDSPCSSPNLILGSGWDDPITEQALFRLEKLYLRYAKGGLEVQFGDFYASIGRGIVLSMVKKPEVDQDNSLRGARFDITGRRGGLTLLGGFTNPQEISMELRNQGIDKLDQALIGGLSLLARPGNNLALSTHGVGYDLLGTPSYSLGGTAELSDIGGVLDLFFEGNGFFYGQEDGSEEDPVRGHAAYFAGTVYAEAVTLLIEAKSYRNSQLLVQPGPVVPLQYNNPPSLEHEPTITEDINGSVQSGNIHGLRIQPELFFPETGTTLTGSMAASVDFEPHPPFSLQHELSIHPWIAIDQPLHLGKADLHLLADFGYRHDFPLRSDKEPGISNAESQSRAEQYLSHTGMLHYAVDLSVTFGKHSFELVSRYRRHAVTLENDVCWDRNGSEHCDRDDGWISTENAISYTLMGKYTIALLLDHTDDPIVQSLANNGAIGNLHFNKEWRRSTYIGAELILKPSSMLEIYVFGGSQKAGIVCTGGACRTVPAFTGVKTRVSVSF
ncbi:MAG: hypothetical protein CMP23_04025 [Rickettsiales bacterium]|nr:hypothetical protein [Rickettsiales bacterium]